VRENAAEFYSALCAVHCAHEKKEEEEMRERGGREMKEEEEREERGGKEMRDVHKVCVLFC